MDYEALPNISSYEDVEKLVRGGVPEELHLEYKSGRPKNKDQFKNEIAQDISAFANADGGTLIIGVSERDHQPVAIDGVDEAYFSRESLGQVIAYGVRPNISGLRIAALRGSLGLTILVVSIPKSDHAPHQGPNHKYFRRYEHHNQPMAHHEIEDLRRRQLAVPPLVVVTTATRSVILTAVDVRNPGDYPADDITFEFSSNLIWPKDEIPAPFANGMKHLSPGQRLRFRAQTFAQLLSKPDSPATFEVRVEYTHSGIQKRMSHVWPLDFEAYRGSMSILTDEHQDRKDTQAELVKIRETLAEITRCVKDCLPKLVGANGLDLSVYTLRNLQNIAAGGSIDRLSPKWLSASDFHSALDIEVNLASMLERLFWDKLASREEVCELEGMTPEILERFERTFQLGESPR
jgi:hypothetical protein